MAAQFKDVVHIWSEVKAKLQYFDELKKFIIFAGRFSRYNYSEIAFIYAQRPDATMVARKEIWEKIGRSINAGAKEIGCFAFGSTNCTYLYDVSDTNGKTVPKQWTLHHPELQSALTVHLLKKYNIDGGTIIEAVNEVVEQSVDDHFEEYYNDLIEEASQEFFIGKSEEDIVEAFYQMLSSYGQLMTWGRCELNGTNLYSEAVYLDDELLQTVSADDMQILITLICKAGSRAIRELEAEILYVVKEGEKQNERTTELSNDREQNLQTDDNDGKAGRTDRVLRRVVDELDERVPPNPDGSPRDERTVVSDSSAGSAGSPGQNRFPEPTLRKTESSTDSRVSGNSRLGKEPADVGGSHRDGRNDLPGKIIEENNSEAVSNDTAFLFGDKHRSKPKFKTESGYGFMQLSLFGDFDTIEPESIMPVENDTFSSSINQDMVDHVLRAGSYEPYSLERIVAQFEKNKGVESNAEFLRKVFHTDGRGFKYESPDDLKQTLLSVWYDKDGITLAVGKTAKNHFSSVSMTWEQAAERIGELLTEGRFATQDIIDAAEQYERKQLAEKLWYLHQDVEVEYFIPDEFFKDRFPESTERIVEALQNQKFVQEFIDGMTDLIKQYEANPDVLRFHYHNLPEMLEGLKDLQLDRVKFKAEPSFIVNHEYFITEDEKDKLIISGSGVQGGKFRISEFFSKPHTAKEKIDFLKNEYGIGGIYQDGYDTWHDSKGLVLKKGGLDKPSAEVTMKWDEVEERVTKLVSQNLYITEDEKNRLSSAQKIDDNLKVKMDRLEKVNHELALDQKEEDVYVDEDITGKEELQLDREYEL